MVRTCIWIRKLEADILELGLFKQILILLGRCHQSEHSQVLGECGRDGGKRRAQWESAYLWHQLGLTLSPLNNVP